MNGSGQNTLKLSNCFHSLFDGSYMMQVIEFKQIKNNIKQLHYQ